MFISGAAALVGAGAMGLGGAAADIIISRNKCKEVQAIINRDVELTTELQLLEQVRSRNNYFPQPNIMVTEEWYKLHW